MPPLDSSPYGVQFRCDIWASITFSHRSRRHRGTQTHRWYCHRLEFWQCKLGFCSFPLLFTNPRTKSVHMADCTRIVPDINCPLSLFEPIYCCMLPISVWSFQPPIERKVDFYMVSDYRALSKRKVVLVSSLIMELSIYRISVLGRINVITPLHSCCFSWEWNS